MWKNRWAITWYAAALYAASFFLPACGVRSCPDGTATFPGYAAFVVGLWALLGYIPTPEVLLAWLANPVIWLSLCLVLAGRWHAARVAAVGSLLLPLPLVMSMGLFVLGYPGYWAWSGSAALIVVWSSYVIRTARRSAVTPPPASPASCP